MGGEGRGCSMFRYCDRRQEGFGGVVAFTNIIVVISRTAEKYERNENIHDLIELNGCIDDRK